MILAHDLLINENSAALLASLPPTRRLIDIGCGIRPCPAFACEDYICIEPHDEYVAELRKWTPPFAAKLTVHEGPAEVVADEMRRDTTVLLIDVIEHMERDEGEHIRDLLEEFEHAVIFTPLGWYEQGDTNPDPWGFNGGYWQKHRSAWQPEDFPNWHVHSWPVWHAVQPVGAIMAIR